MGLGQSVEGFILPTGEFRYGSAYVSQLLGYSDKYFDRFRKSLQGNKKAPKKLKTLISKGFTGEQIRVKAVRPTGGLTRAYTISFDDVCIWIEHEGFDLGNPNAKALLSASFREILRGRTQEAFEEITGKAPDSSEKRIVQCVSKGFRIMPRGGRRDGAGSKSKWRHGSTKPIRVPVALADQVLDFARALDQGAINFPAQVYVIDMSGLPIGSVNQKRFVCLQDLMSKGYEIVPLSLAQQVRSEMNI